MNEFILGNIKRFESLLTSVKRDGTNNLLEYIRKTDFYSAPASTRYHSCHEGGLLEHSLNVYDCLTYKLKNNKIWADKVNNVEQESIILSALLHDLCKTNYYEIEMKNKKVYSEHGSKSDNNGRFDWESVPCYTVDDKIPYGHGEKSVMMIESFINLKPIERYAIRWHMGFTEPKELYGSIGQAYKKYPLALLMHEADLEATYFFDI